jgi:hypothetical protein
MTDSKERAFVTPHDMRSICVLHARQPAAGFVMPAVLTIALQVKLQFRNRQGKHPTPLC